MQAASGSTYSINVLTCPSTGDCTSSIQAHNGTLTPTTYDQLQMTQGSPFNINTAVGPIFYANAVGLVNGSSLGVFEQ